MKGSWVVRLKTALLVVVVLTGGGGMPLLDLALYHGLTPDRSAAPHYESRTPHAHGDTCRLSSSLSHCPEVGTLDLHLPFVASAGAEPPAPLSVPRTTHAGLPSARAPPSLIAPPFPQLT